MAHPTFRLGSLTLDDFLSAYSAAVALETTVRSKRHELQGLIAKRSNQAKALKELSSRALSGFRAVYGPDSPQYTQAGGTRTSNRAPRIGPLIAGVKSEVGRALRASRSE
jgi:hypothetical protein